ncbi:CP family cyanate transporter-like MFS transporter [Salsuginibacillus halophilus]|uniref:CP family cyanate transporter-like MFS transporter n=1 Tax=Salsuginibacillus halophilus TaxID=517424 RepID=A0A2P8HBE2_9BACI|nr:MFS transporter [Salsuginibacillus halophilus]PSL43545.1 CP family cyanate transporter-like MFS transporter [Salsuginibacillus halophilus]
MQLSSRFQFILFVAGIIFIAFNLRPAITAVGPVIPFIREDTGMSSAAAGSLTTIPLIAFAIFSIAAPRFGRRVGLRTALFIALIVLSAGIFIRTAPFVPAILIGTAFIGTGIAVLNVLLPGLIKESFPAKVGVMTSLYTSCMALMASIASGISVPLADNAGLGWNGSLAVWGILAVLALFTWLPQILHYGTHNRPEQTETVARNYSLWRSPLAWYVTLFMGFQSFLFYNVIAWLPDVLQSFGLTLSFAGWLLFLLQIVGLPGSFAVPLIAEKLKNQKPLIGVICTVYILSLTGLLSALNLPVIIISVILLGLGQGMAISLALTFFGLRAANARDAAGLSGMAQSFGYLIASVGPVAMGMVYDLFGTWEPFLFTLLAAVACIGIFGWRSAEAKYV